MSPKVTTSSVDKRDKKRKFRTDGTAIWTRPIVDGPGVWVSCVKGKERQTVGELYDLFESLADELWPQSSAAATSSAVPGDDGSDNSDDDDDGLSLEQQIARQVAAIKRPRREQRFANCNTNTPCLVFISTKPPVDPVQLVTRHINNVRQTGVTGTRNTHRLTPVSASCTANLPEIRSLATRVLRAFFDSQPERSYSYKIELHVRNHSTLARDVILREIASCVPPGHTVQLGNPEIFILVEVFKAVCGIGIVRDYYDLQKFNVMELAAAVAKERAAETVEAGPSDNSTVTAQPLEPVPTT